MSRPVNIINGKRKCPKCEISKSLDMFNKLTGKRSHLYDSFCITCRRDYSNERRRGNRIYREKENKRRIKTRLENPEWKNHDNEIQRIYYKNNVRNNKEKMKARRESRDKYFNKNRERIRAMQAENRKSLRIEFIQNYGGKCECCGEHRFEFLGIEHNNGGGRKERKKKSTESLLRVLRKEGWKRDGKYSLLCSNCNHARGAYGYCPHERE